MPRSKRLRLMLISGAIIAVILLACGQSNHTGEVPTLDGHASTSDAAANATTSVVGSTVTAIAAENEFAYTAADGTVWLANARSGATRQLISAPVGICTGVDCGGHDAQWSPDGRYLSYRSNDRRLIALEVDTGRETVIDDTGGEGQRGFESRWAPDATRIAYSKASLGPEDRGLWIADLSGGTRQVASNVYQFEWSPDSTRIAISSSLTGDADGGLDKALFVVNADGTGLRGVVDRAVLVGAFLWSPDGRLIAYWRNNRGGSAIIGDMTALDVDSGDEISLGEFSSDEFPQWAPDRTRDVFQNELVDPASGRVDDLFPRPSVVLGWSPDMSKVAYVEGPGFGGGEHALVVLDLQSGDRQTIDTRQPPPAHAANPGYGTAWSHDGRYLAFTAFGASFFDWIGVTDLAAGGIQHVAAANLWIFGSSYAPGDRLLLISGDEVVDNVETNRGEIWVANADGSGARQVAEGTPLSASDRNGSAWRPARK